MPTPFVSKRAPIYGDVPDEKWNDWRWQLSHRLNTVEEIEKILPLNESERKALQTSGLFRVDITPYFISLIDPNDPDDPIRKQVIPLSEEMQSFTAMMEDSLAEDRHSPVPGLVHRYPDRVLDAGNNSMRVVLPLLYALAYRRRSGADLLAPGIRITDRVSQTHSSGARCAAFRWRSAGVGTQNSRGNPQTPARDSAYRNCPNWLAGACFYAYACHPGIMRYAGKISPALAKYPCESLQRNFVGTRTSL